MDVALLATAFARACGKRISAGALARLGRHAWPGNVRELRSVTEARHLASLEDAADPGAGPVAGSLGGLDGDGLPTRSSAGGRHRPHVPRVVRITAADPHVP